MKMILVSEDALESIKRMAQEDAKDAAMFRALKARLNARMTPANDSWSIVATDPMYGDSKTVHDWETRIAAMQAKP